jgi:class 3 adenylate cyclase
MSAAGSGEILISDAVRNALASSELVTADRGEHQLKGVPGRWQLYAVDAL